MTVFQPGDFILFHGDSFISRGISIATKSPWTHAAIYVGGGSRYIIESTLAGVEKNSLDHILPYASAYCVLRIPGLTAEGAEILKSAAYARLTDKYDFYQLLTLGIYFSVRRLFGRAPAFLVGNMPNRLTCSELCAECAAELGIKFAKKNKMVTPATLFNSKLLQVVVNTYSSSITEEK